MSKKLGVKISPGRISPNFVKFFPHAFLLEDRFLLDLGKIYNLLELMKLAPNPARLFSVHRQRADSEDPSAVE